MGARARTLRIVLACALAVGLAACSNRISYLEKGRQVGAYRWKVTELKERQLSEDQVAVLRDKGPPDQVRFYNHLERRGESLLGRVGARIGQIFVENLIHPFNTLDRNYPVSVWVYGEEGELVWFDRGARVDYVAVED